MKKTLLPLLALPSASALLSPAQYHKRHAPKTLYSSPSSVLEEEEPLSTFGTREYWDEVYDGRGDFPAEEYSWYYSFEGYKKYVMEYIPEKTAKILVPGVGNDTMLLDLLQKGYRDLTAFDYSEPAIERQKELLSYEVAGETVDISQMDARELKEEWTDQFDAILEKGALDAIHLSGPGNLELSVRELERVLKPGGILISVSGVVPEDVRRSLFSEWEWLRDGSEDLDAGRFVLQSPTKQ